MVKVKLHGALGEELGSEWELNVSSVAEAFRAIEANTKKLTRMLIEQSKNDAKYEILINNRPMWVPNGESLPNSIKEVKKEHFELMYRSEIVMDMGDTIKTIDVVPVIEGAGGGGGGGGGKGGGGKSGGGKGGGGKGGFFGIFLSIILAPFTGGSSLLMAILPAIIGLVALGVSMLLMKPPPMVSPQAIANPSATFEASPDGGGGEPSYMFNGPVNTVGEGGPIPVGYGRLIIGSHQVFASYDQVYRLQSRSNKYSGGKPPTDGGEYNFPTKSYFFDHFGRPLTLEDVQRNPFSQSSLGV